MLVRDSEGNLHIGIPIKFRHEPGRIDPRLPKLGQHTEELLGSLKRGTSKQGEDPVSDARPRGMTRRLARLLRRPIAAADRDRAALHVLDWLGCAAAGATTAPGKAMISYGRTMPDGPCRAVGGLTLSSRDAALVNGAVGNVLEMDDFYRTALVHPGPVVVPAALAVAQETGASKEAFLDAVIRGFEAMIRVGRSVGPTHYKHFHNTATCGVFGSAAAAGSLLGLTEDQLVDAFGNAATQASGLWQCRLEDSMSKQLHNGRAAQSGIIAAQLSLHGFTGAEARPGRAPRLLQRPLPGRPARASPRRADGPMARPRHQLQALAGLPAYAPDDRRRARDPRTGRRTERTPDHRRNLPRRHRRLRPNDADDRRRGEVQPAARERGGAAARHAASGGFREPGYRGARRDPLRAKVELRENATYTAAYPAHFGARMRVELENGEVVTHDVPDALGDPENPLPQEALCGKAQMLLASAGYSTGAAEELVSAALALASGGTADALAARIA